MDLEEFEARWRKLVAEGLSEGEAFTVLEAEWPVTAARYMRTRTEVLAAEIARELEDS